jgi:diguanylate cyclase (GGDEF)-like protein
MSLFTVFTIIYIQENSIHKSKKNIPESFTKYLNEKVDSEASILGEYMTFIQNMDDVTQKFITSDKKELNNSIKEIYSRLNKNINLTHMYFINTDGSVLLRVHDYAKDKDIVERTTFKKAQESHSAYYGLEFGLKKNYTLRVVKPWYKDGELIGYLELGKEIDKVVDDLSNFLKTHIYMAVKKEIYADAPTFVKEELKQKTQTADYYIAYNTFAIPYQIELILKNVINIEDIELQNRQFFVSKSTLSDVTGKKLGYFVFLSDVSLEHKIMYHSAKLLTIILIIISSVLIVGAYLLIQRKEKSIHLLASKLNKQKEELSHSNTKFQKLFDLQKNIVIMRDKKKLVMANQAMFDFFGIENLNSFLKHYDSICDRFVENDDYFHKAKVPKGKDWAEVIMNFPDNKRIVLMIDNKMETHAFSLSINEFEKGSYVVSFADISNTMIEHKKLQIKVTHDKLTNALNREFFDNNIDLIIEEVKPSRLGVIFCDIDYFKNINDTYGHNRGDIVLKALVKVINKSIRQEDYLIRWGGEEFIILMKIDTVESLKKAVENIRYQIAEQHFDDVGNITASFGCTLLEKEDEIMECIERADKALYVAKENGRNQVQIV